MKRFFVLVTIVLALAVPSVKAELSVAAPLSQGPVIHSVRLGETLSIIARLYGTTVTTLVRANNLPNPNLIWVGQHLVIPTREQGILPSSYYTVLPGDSLSMIAARLGTTVSALIQANGLSDPNLIFVGQELFIPGSAHWPTPILMVQLVPDHVAQGHTLLVEVYTSEEASLSGTVDDQPLYFTGSGSNYWALAGFSPSSTPGAHGLSLTVTSAKGEGVATATVLVTPVDFPIQYIELSPERSGLLAPDIVEPEWARLLPIFSQVTPAQLWQGKFIVPVEGEISSEFGMRRSYNHGPVASYHLGLDYSAPGGKEVYAANSGRVALAEELAVRGKTVIIDHGLGLYSSYYHLSGIAVTAGQMVGKGQIVGYVGSTGLSTGDHLHWEMRINAVGIDPLEWTQRAMPEE